MAIITDENRENTTKIIRDYRFKLSFEEFEKMFSMVILNREYYDEYKKDDGYYITIDELEEFTNYLLSEYNYHSGENDIKGLTKEELIYFNNKEKNIKEVLNKYFSNGKCKFDVDKLLFDEDYNLTYDDFLIILENVYNLKKTYNESIEYRNYKSYKENIFKSLSYFLSEEEIKPIKDRYNMLTSTIPINIDKLRKLINNINNITKEYNLTKFTDINIHNNANYSYVVHSIKSPRWNGKFWNKLASASIINNNFNGLYSFSVGFILNPNSMISASDRDTYTSNNMYKGGFSSVGINPVIYSYDMIIENCIKYKKENPDTRIYNEVVLSEFDPIAIFYFPDPKGYNYDMALSLQEQVKELYPNLEIIEINPLSKNISDDNYSQSI